MSRSSISSLVIYPCVLNEFRRLFVDCMLKLNTFKSHNACNDILVDFQRIQSRLELIEATSGATVLGSEITVDETVEEVCITALGVLLSEYKKALVEAPEVLKELGELREWIWETIAGAVGTFSPLITKRLRALKVKTGFILTGIIMLVAISERYSKDPNYTTSIHWETTRTSLQDIIAKLNETPVSIPPRAHSMPEITELELQRTTSAPPPEVVTEIQRPATAFQRPTHARTFSGSLTFEVPRDSQKLTRKQSTRLKKSPRVDKSALGSLVNNEYATACEQSYRMGDLDERERRELQQTFALNGDREQVNSNLAGAIEAYETALKYAISRLGLQDDDARGKGERAIKEEIITLCEKLGVIKLRLGSYHQAREDYRCAVGHASNLPLAKRFFIETGLIVTDMKLGNVDAAKERCVDLVWDASRLGAERWVSEKGVALHREIHIEESWKDTSPIPFHYIERASHKLVVMAKETSKMSGSTLCSSPARTPSTSPVSGDDFVPPIPFAPPNIIELSPIPLHQAVLQGQTKEVRRMLRSGYNRNSVNEAGENALHLAVKQGMVTIAEMLIKGGVDMNRQDKSGQTPFGIAQTKRLDGIVKLMKKKGGMEE